MITRRADHSAQTIHHLRSNTLISDVVHGGIARHVIRAIPETFVSAVVRGRDALELAQTVVSSSSGSRPATGPPALATACASSRRSRSCIARRAEAVRISDRRGISKRVAIHAVRERICISDAALVSGRIGGRDWRAGV